MRDLLPHEATRRRHLATSLTERFSAFGYELVTTPPFEQADVIERGLDALDPRDVLRFVDADTGEIALMRPDITPQVARLVATRLQERPPPFRLAYEGQVIRRRHGRARRQRQIAQAGVECIGLAGPEADVEVIELAARCLASLGLTEYRVELGLPPLARELLQRVPDPYRRDAAEHLSRKDRRALEHTLGTAGLRGSGRTELLSLVDLWGGSGVLDDAQRMFRGLRPKALLRQLEEVRNRLTERGLGGRLAFDLGEARGFGYYTGPSFVLLAQGPGEPVGGGGRYDDLLGRFGATHPATGFGIDLDHLDWALSSAAVPSRARPVPRVSVRGSSRQAERVVNALRGTGASVASLAEMNADSAMAHGRAWAYDAVFEVEGSRVAGVRMKDSAQARWTVAAVARDGSAAVRWAQNESVPKG